MAFWRDPGEGFLPPNQGFHPPPPYPNQGYQPSNHGFQPSNQGVTPNAPFPMTINCPNCHATIPMDVFNPGGSNRFVIEDGPYGGNGGEAWSDESIRNSKGSITAIKIYSNIGVYGIQTRLVLSGRNK